MLVLYSGRNHRKLVSLSFVLAESLWWPYRSCAAKVPAASLVLTLVLTASAAGAHGPSCGEACAYCTFWRRCSRAFHLIPLWSPGPRMTYAHNCTVCLLCSWLQVADHADLMLTFGVCAYAVSGRGEVLVWPKARARNEDWMNTTQRNAAANHASDPARSAKPNSLGMCARPGPLGDMDVVALSLLEL